MSSFGGSSSGCGGVEAPIINPSSVRLPTPVVVDRRQEEEPPSDSDSCCDDDDDLIVPAPQSWFASYDDEDDEEEQEEGIIMEDKKEELEGNVNQGRRNSKCVVQRQESMDTPPLSFRREEQDGVVTLYEEDVRATTPDGGGGATTISSKSCRDNDELFSSSSTAADLNNSSTSRSQQQQQQRRSNNNNNNSSHIIPKNRRQQQQQQPKKKHKNKTDATIPIGSPLPSPSWKEVSSQILPKAASELLSSSLNRICYTARLSYYERLRKYRAHSELGNNIAIGYYRSNNNNNADGEVGGEESRSKSLIAALPELPPFSSLPWVERQLVQEWRTYRPEEEDDVVAKDANDAADHDHDDEEDEFDLARHLVPNPIPRPTWQKSENCYECNKPFGPTRLRHHCRLCGHSYCQAHSAYSHKLPHLGYHPDVPERVCDTCKHMLLEQNLAERVAWRLARCRDYFCNKEEDDDENENGCNGSQLTPYFETGVDTVEDAALRVTKAALEIARSIPLGAQATIAVETVDVLRQHGLNGIYTIMLRQEFLAAADILRKALGINRTAWPLSVHELSAAIFYALAQHRAMRGMKPEREHLIHSFRSTTPGSEEQQLQQKPNIIITTAANSNNNSVVVDSERNVDDAAIYKIEEAADVSDLVSNSNGARTQEDTSGSTDDDSPTTSRPKPEPLPFQPVCDPVPDSTLNHLLLYAPLALTFIYAEKEVDMQLLAAQQGWRLLYAYLDQETGKKITDRPASAFFVHEEQNVACIAVRGTSTIHDIVTDIRQVPVPFPENDADDDPNNNKSDADEEWTTVFRGNGLAVCGMAVAAVNLYREHIDSILFFARQGYRIRITGHSLGGGVGTLLGALVYRDLERESLIGNWDEATSSEADAPLRVYTYGTPSCVDARLAENVAPFVTTVVLHDDVVPRLTPASCRGLLKHLLNIKETWMKEFLPGDIRAITERAKLVWAPRWRGSFTLSKSSSSIKRYCRKQLQYGKKQLLSVKDKLVGEECVDPTGCLGGGSTLERIDERSEDLRAAEPSGDTKADSRPENDIEEEKKHLADGEDPTETEEIRLFPDYMGGIDCRTEGMVIDGDEFFDTEENLLEGSDDDESDDGCELNTSMYQSTYREPAAAVEGIRDQSVGDGDDSAVPATASEGDDNDFESPGAVVLEETPLPRMFVPGKVVHIYSHRGVFRAAYVPRTFKELRRITLQGNMLSDHRTKSYYEALLEVRSVRNAAESPPKWSAFDEDVTCSCCAAVFTWASTSDSEAQEARDKHNCRSCGTLVCHPCSTNMIPVPSIGLTVPARVCDRCYNDIGGMLTRPRRQENTFALSNDSSPTSKSASSSTLEDKPERQRERRSAVVDELASRVQASSLTS